MIKKLNMKSSFIMGIVAILFISIIISCETNENDYSETSKRKTEIKSYSDLFESFWYAMNDNYNYFKEERDIRGLDWDAIYKEYYPKFAKLTTFEDSKADKKLALKEFREAVRYFYRIISPLLDKHLLVDISFNVPVVGFKGGVWFYSLGRDSNNSEDWIEKIPYSYSKSQLPKMIDAKEWMNYTYNELLIPNQSIKSRIFAGGPFKSNPDIYYFSLRAFQFSTIMSRYGSNFDFRLANKEFEKIDPSIYTYNKIKDSKLKTFLRKNISEYINESEKELSDLINSKVYNDYEKYYEQFENDEKVSSAFESNILSLRDKFKQVDNGKSKLIYSNINDKFDSLKNTGNYDAFDLRIAKSIISTAQQNVELQYYITGFYSSIFNIRSLGLIKSYIRLYRNFLNKITDGTIKKLIFDLRGNGGGFVSDAYELTSRLVHKPTIFAYQRTKLGNGRFNYTPWIPLSISPHKFALKKPIQIIILTDQGSASMSEITTMMLKSQSSMVKSIGDYSIGATAALGSNENYNGGYYGRYNSHLYFKMPFMAFKDYKNNIIENVGVKPDILIVPTAKEIIKNRKSRKDPVLEKAIEMLK